MRISDWSSDVCSSDLEAAQWLSESVLALQHNLLEFELHVLAVSGTLDPVYAKLHTLCDGLKAEDTGRGVFLDAGADHGETTILRRVDAAQQDRKSVV